jgi:hypothetical protein
MNMKPEHYRCLWFFVCLNHMPVSEKLKNHQKNDVDRGEEIRHARREAARERRRIFCFADSVCGENRTDQTTAIHETRLELDHRGMARIDEDALKKMLDNIPFVCREAPLREPVYPPGKGPQRN